MGAAPPPMGLGAGPPPMGSPAAVEEPDPLMGSGDAGGVLFIVTGVPTVPIGATLKRSGEDRWMGVTGSE